MFDSCEVEILKVELVMFFLLYAGRSNVLKQLSSHHRQNSDEGDLMEGEKNVSPILSMIHLFSLISLLPISLLVNILCLKFDLKR